MRKNQVGVRPAAAGPFILPYGVVTRTGRTTRVGSLLSRPFSCAAHRGADWGGSDLEATRSARMKGLLPFGADTGAQCPLMYSGAAYAPAPRGLSIRPLCVHSQMLWSRGVRLNSSPPHPVPSETYSPDHLEYALKVIVGWSMSRLSLP